MNLSINQTGRPVRQSKEKLLESFIYGCFLFSLSGVGAWKMFVVSKYYKEYGNMNITELRAFAGVEFDMSRSLDIIFEI